MQGEKSQLRTAGFSGLQGFYTEKMIVVLQKETEVFRKVIIECGTGIIMIVYNLQ